MGGVGSWELILIMLVALVVFGAKRIPEIARGLGKGLSEFKRAARDIQVEINREIDLTEGIQAPPTRPEVPESPEQTVHPRDQAEFEPPEPPASDPADPASPTEASTDSSA